MADPKLIIRIAPDPAAKSRRSFRLHRVPGTSITFPYQIYRRRNGSPYFVYQYYLHGRRIQESRQTEKSFHARAKEIAAGVSNGELQLLKFSEAQRASYLRGVENLSGTGATIEHATDKYRHWRARLSDADIEIALQLFIENRPAIDHSKLVADICNEMLEKMERDGSGQRWIDDLRSRLQPTTGKWNQPVKSFCENFACPIGQLRAPAIAAWLDSLKFAPRTRNNYRGAILALPAFAKKRGYLPRNWSEMEAVDAAKIKRKAARFYTPEQLANLLSVCPDNFAPFIALQAFAGIRTRELVGDRDHPAIDWSDINLQERLIKIPIIKAKERTPERFIPISENLALWLSLYAKRSGPVCSLVNISGALKRACKRAGIPVMRNGLRKGFISHRVAVVKDIGQVSLEAGNSPDIIKANYYKAVEETTGAAWFAINPVLPTDCQLRLFK